MFCQLSKLSAITNIWAGWGLFGGDADDVACRAALYANGIH